MMTKSCVIFDLDGALADVRHRLHHIRRHPKDWPAFFAAAVDDEPGGEVKLINGLIGRCNERPFGQRLEIFICTARPEKYREATEKWLQLWCIEYNHLLMRPERDYRSDIIVKREMLIGIRGQGFEPVLAIDDRPSVVAMWRAEGVPCLAVDDAEWKRSPRGGLDEGRTLLTLMVGPSGAGKSAWLGWDGSVLSGGEPLPAVAPWCLGIHPSHVLSSDQLRDDLHAEQTQPQRVFAALHAIAAARLAHGLPVVIDATHLRRKDRLAAADLAPAGTRVRYVVVDRQLADKLAAVRGNVPEDVIRRHDQAFRSQRKEILAGDERADVDVVDLTTGDK